ncbi:hypothetical protein V6N13_121616 [Hibiscus sabdariffa]
MVTFGTESPEIESFILRHHRNRDILNADKDDHGMDSRECGYELAKYSWYSFRQLIIKQTDTKSSDRPKVGAQFSHQIHWQLSC